MTEPASLNRLEIYTAGYDVGYEAGYYAHMLEVKIKHRAYNKKYALTHKDAIRERHRLSNKAYRERQIAKRKQEKENAGQ